MKRMLGLQIHQKETPNTCFPVNIAKFLIALDLKNICVWLLLKIIENDFLEKPSAIILHNKYGELNVKERP